MILKRKLILRENIHLEDLLNIKNEKITHEQKQENLRDKFFVPALLADDTFKLETGK